MAANPLADVGHLFPIEKNFRYRLKDTAKLTYQTNFGRTTIQNNSILASKYQSCFFLFVRKLNVHIVC